MIPAIIRNSVVEAKDIVRLVIGRADNTPLPPFDAGAHLDIKLPSGLLRQYSLCRLQSDQRYYEIAVLKDPKSRGGSKEMHRLAIGDRVEISEPKNHFSLVNPSKKTLLIAGGIGVTPLLPMAQVLKRQGTPFTFHYCAKSPETAAFAKALQQGSFAENMVFHFSQSPESGRMNVQQVLAKSIDDTDLYVCGPAEFITDILEQARLLGWREEALHREFFAAPSVDNNALTNNAFTVKIASTGQQFAVSAEQSIAEVLDKNGIFLPISCGSGVCGTCQTKVLAGEPEHRDVFLTAQEQQRGQLIMPCCSRAKTDSLTLDL